MRPVVLPAPPSSNRATRSIIARGRPVRVATGEAKRWRTRAVAALADAGGVADSGGEVADRSPVWIRIAASVSRRRDVDNVVKPCLDAMVRAGVIPDDRWADRIEALRADGPPGLVSIEWGPLPPDFTRPVIAASPELLADLETPIPRPSPPPKRAAVDFEAAWSAAEESSFRRPGDRPEDGWTIPVWIAHSCAWRAGGGADVVARAARRAAERYGGELPPGWDTARKAEAIRERVAEMGTSIRDLAQRGGLVAGASRRQRTARRDAEILRLEAAGVSESEIARRLAISRKSVWRVRRRAQQPEEDSTP